MSPFGKVVKVVRTAPEPKKRPRRESFTDEPALFSQPDVLHKEHEPLAAPVPAPSPATPATTAGPTAPVAATPTTPKPAFPSDESVYDSVEAHVARLAGGLEHSLVPTAAPTPVAAVPVVNAPAAQPAGAIASQQHKPTTAARHGENCTLSLLGCPLICEKKVGTVEGRDIRNRVTLFETVQCFLAKLSLTVSLMYSKTSIIQTLLIRNFG